MNHAAYVSWKYAKAWEKQKTTSHHGDTEKTGTEQPLKPKTISSRRRGKE
jgi:hypothetical protein